MLLFPSVLAQTAKIDFGAGHVTFRHAFFLPPKFHPLRHLLWSATMGAERQKNLQLKVSASQPNLQILQGGLHIHIDKGHEMI